MELNALSAGMAVAVVVAECLAVQGLLLLTHALRHRWSLAPFFTTLGCLTTIMWWFNDTNILLRGGGLVFHISSLVFFSALLVGVTAVYILDGQKAARIAVSTILGVSALMPFVTLLWRNHLYATVPGLPSRPLAEIARGYASSLVTSLIVFALLIALWEILARHAARLGVGLRFFAAMLVAMVADALLYLTLAFHGQAQFWSTLTSTIAGRVMMTAAVTPLMALYLRRELKRGRRSLREEGPLLALFKTSAQTERELRDAYSEIERQRTEEQALKKTQQNLAAVFDNMADLVFILDLQGHLLHTNRVMASRLGYRALEMVGLPMTELRRPEQRLEVLAALAEVVRGERTLCRIPLRARDGEIIPVETRFTRGTWSGIEVVFGVARDIGDQLRAEAERRRSEERYRMIFDHSPMGILHFDESGVLRDCNEKLAELLGSTRERLIGLRMLEDLADEEVKEAVRCALRGEVGRFEGDYRSVTSGKVIPLRITFSRVLDDQDAFAGAVGVVEDITDRKRAEESLQRLATAVDQAAESIVVTDVQATIVYVNPAFERTSGYAAAEVCGHNARILKSGRHDPIFYQEMWHTISGGRIWSSRILNRRKNGEIYEEQITISPVRDPRGRTVNFVSVQRDISHEVKLERHLRRVQKMEALGTLAGGIAHDFNNVLAAILGFTDMALEKIGPQSAAEEDLREVVKAGRRAKDLVDQILAFGRESELRHKPIVVYPLVLEALNMLRASLPTTIEIVPELDTTPATVLGDPGQVHQIVMNLCTNAFHAMRHGGGVLTVRLDHVQIEEAQARLESGLTAGEFIRLTVADTGVGMDPALLDRIFDPFFTTKPSGEGTGMGLSVVHGIVTSYGGAVAVESSPGKGTRFTVYLPRHGVDGTLQEAAPKATPGASGRERILLVDDEPQLATLGRRLLERMGYRVIALTSSTEALALFERDPSAFDLVITDQTMPHMTGTQLSRILLGLRPDLPILIVTGYSAASALDDEDPVAIRGCLSKPIDRDELAAAIRRALDTKTTT